MDIRFHFSIEISTYWRIYHSLLLSSATFVINQVSVYVWIYFWVLSFLFHCLFVSHHTHITLLLELPSKCWNQKSKVSIWFLFFISALAIFGLLHFLINFRTNLPSFSPAPMPAGFSFPVDTTWHEDCFWEYCISRTLSVLIHAHDMCLCLFRPLKS